MAAGAVQQAPNGRSERNAIHVLVDYHSSSVKSEMIRDKRKRTNMSSTKCNSNNLTAVAPSTKKVSANVCTDTGSSIKVKTTPTASVSEVP